MAGRGQPKTGGRKRGAPNKMTALLKDAILEAAQQAGGDTDGLVAYLKQQAMENPSSFMPLLGKVLPLQAKGSSNDGEPAHLTISFE
jgi:hypothetical protein